MQFHLGDRSSWPIASYQLLGEIVNCCGCFHKSVAQHRRATDAFKVHEGFNRLRLGGSMGQLGGMDTIK